MSILSELNTLLTGLNIPTQTITYEGLAPETYCVLTPLSDEFSLFADNTPLLEINEVQVSLFTKNNYLGLKRRITNALLNADFTITARRYLGREEDTKYHHYAIDAAKHYEFE